MNYSADMLVVCVQVWATYTLPSHIFGEYHVSLEKAYAAGIGYAHCWAMLCAFNVYIPNVRGYPPPKLGHPDPRMSFGFGIQQGMAHRFSGYNPPSIVPSTPVRASVFVHTNTFCLKAVYITLPTMAPLTHMYST